MIKTSTRQTIFLPIPGLVDVKELKPGDLVGTNKDSYLILERLPAEYDSRVKAMEVRRGWSTATDRNVLLVSSRIECMGVWLCWCGRWTRSRRRSGVTSVGWTSRSRSSWR